MVRFEKIGDTYVNVDKIRCFWREENGKVLAVELDDGQVLRTRDVRYGLLEERISGSGHIVQVIPCVKPLYVRYRGEAREIYESPVDYIALCANGDIRPLETCGMDGMLFFDEMSNYVGLFCGKLEEEKEEDD